MDDFRPRRTQSNRPPMSRPQGRQPVTSNQPTPPEVATPVTTQPTASPISTPSSGASPINTSPERPTPTQPAPVQPPATPESLMPPVSAPQPISSPDPSTPSEGTGSIKPKKSRKKKLIWVGLALLVALLVAIGGLVAWYFTQLSPVDTSKTDRQVHTVVAGSTPDMIAAALKEDGLIRDETAFLWYAKLNRTENKLQAGTYRLSPSESTPDIIGHLQKGSTDEFTITFLPGDTLDAHRKVLESAGYEADEIERAFSATYEHPLLASKPANASLEGYIYGQTYQIASGSSVQTILEKTFDQFYGEIEEKNLIASLEAKGYTLHEALTLGSIIQREEKDTDNQRKVAGVFLNRLEIDMLLQSDPTFIYAARQIGAPETSQVDSPYNTYKYAGLPPGPIASPNVTALEAIVNPEPSEFLYFLSGDDDQLYFASTFEEHERNIQNYCQQKCFSY